MLFPASLIPKKEIVVNVRQHLRISFLPEFQGGTVRFEDFSCRLIAEVSPALIRSSRAPEQSVMFHPANRRNRVVTMPVKLNDSSSDALLQMEKGSAAVELRALQDNELLSRLKNGAVFDFFDAH
jgi:hypothetical protein